MILKKIPPALIVYLKSQVELDRDKYPYIQEYHLEILEQASKYQWVKDLNFETYQKYQAQICMDLTEEMFLKGDHANEPKCMFTCYINCHRNSCTINLAGMDVSGLELDYANLENINLSRANLNFANLYRANITNTSFKATRLDTVIPTGVTELPKDKTQIFHHIFTEDAFKSAEQFKVAFENYEILTNVGVKAKSRLAFLELFFNRINKIAIEPSLLSKMLLQVKSSNSFKICFVDDDNNFFSKAEEDESCQMIINSYLDNLNSAVADNVLATETQDEDVKSNKPPLI